MSWLQRLFPTRSRPGPFLQLESQPPDWAQDLLESIHKVGRAHARAMASIEALDSKLEGGLADLRSKITAMPTAALALPRLDEVLDALDILDEACRALSGSESAIAAHGLSGVADRLQRFLARSGVVRVAEAATPLDGRLFKVVGTTCREDLPDGALAEVVRAAALAGERVVREGEVLINRRH